MVSIHPQSVLFVTLDSCRFDSFERAKAPALKGVGPLHKAMAPGNFTFASHMAMFAGFTPGDPHARQAYINPKYGKIFRLGGFAGIAEPFCRVEGRNIIDGLNRAGFTTISTGAVGWFDPDREPSQMLIRDFQHHFYGGTPYSLPRQLTWLHEQLKSLSGPAFVFINVGETHVPYHYEGAPWDRSLNPCVPFAENNDAEESARRQKSCVEYVDDILAPVLGLFEHANIILTADHGDCWGEDGLWEHGIHHEKVLEVPLLLRLQNPIGDAPSTVAAGAKSAAPAGFWQNLKTRITSAF